MEKAFYSTPELAELLGVFHTTVRRWIERDHIKGFRVGRNYKIPASEVVRMLDEHGLPLPETLRGYIHLPLQGPDPQGMGGKSSGSILQKLLVVDDIQEPAFICRGDTVIGTNQAFAHLTGYTQTDLLGMKLDQLIDKSSCDAVMRCARRCLTEPTDSPVECAAWVLCHDTARSQTTIQVAPFEDIHNVFLAVVRTLEEGVGVNHRNFGWLSRSTPS